MSKTVGIVGAGPSGLAAIKICLEEGLRPTAFEKSTTIGGMWDYDDDTSPSSSGRAYKSLALNTCSVMACYSDFPMPPDFPPFPSHEQYLQYLHEFADHFNLRKHIKLNTEVKKIEKADDYDVTGRWTMVVQQEGEEVVKETFDFVMICSGYFTNPVIPQYPGLDEFTGSVTHTAHYRRNEFFADKNVLMIGESVSSGDIATDISFRAKQVYISVRHGFWLFKKSCLGGYPFDCWFVNRFNISFIPRWLQKYLYEGFLQIDANYDALGIRPDRPIFMSDFVVNDFLLGQFLNGKVKTTKAIERFFKNGVEFVDGTKLVDLDAVVFGTGYKVTTPFIDDDLVPDDLDTRDLYKFVFPVRLPHATLACIGLVSVDCSLPPVAEMQCRWSVQVFKGTITLPPPNKMQEDIAEKLKLQTEIYGKVKHFVLGVPLLDELAEEIGCYPTIKKFLFTDPRLAFKLMFTPVTPSSYRLIGPRQWSGARDAVMNCWEDSLAGLSGKIVKSKNYFFRWLLLLILFLIVMTISIF